MSNRFWVLVSAVLVFSLTGQARAQELLTSGDFEPPGNFGEVIGWDLEEFVTGDATGDYNSNDVVDAADYTVVQDNIGSTTALPNDGGLGTPIGAAHLQQWKDNFGNSAGMGPAINSASIAGNSPETEPSVLFLRAFAGGEDPGPNNLTNAILSQTVDASEGETYTFSGHSRWEFNYSGGVKAPDTLDGGPLGGQLSPTRTNMHLEFLDASDNVIGSQSLDLRDEQSNIDVWVPHELMGVAPMGTAKVRVVAEARDMVWNGASAVPPGSVQSAFFDSFSLTTQSDPATEVLTNPDLDEPLPSALDFWTLTSDPDPSVNDQIIRTATFANHTPGGSLGVWMSSFFGAHPNFEPEPVDGTMSQTVDLGGVEGGSYEFTGWSRFEANYSGGVDTIAAGDGFFAGMDSPTQTLLELAFLDENEDVIGDPVTLDVKADRLTQSPTSNPNDDEWYQHALNAIAPAGAVSARVSGLMIDAVFNTDPGQSMFFDDFSLMLVGGTGSLLAASVPEPSSALLVLIGIVALLSRDRRRR